MFLVFSRRIKTVGAVLFGVLLLFTWAETQPKKILSFEDIMRFKQIEHPVISQDGTVVAYGAQPDRGDGEALIHNLKNGKVVAVERGNRPLISNNSLWAVTVVQPKAVGLAKAEKDKPKQGMALVNTQSGEIHQIDRVEQFAFSEDSVWLAYKLFEERKPEKKEAKKPEEKTKAKKSKPEEKTGTTLALRNVETDQEIQIPYVLSFAFDSASNILVYVIANPGGADNGIYSRQMSREAGPEEPIEKKEKAVFSSLAWAEKGSQLAFLCTVENESGEKRTSLCTWDGQRKILTQAVIPDAVPEGWVLPEKNRLSWTRDGQRLFFGLKLEKYADEVKEEEEEIKEEDLFDTDKILAEREVDVWHWNDPFIIPHQKKMWPRLKDQTYLAVYFPSSRSFIQLADEEMPDVLPSENPDYALGSSGVPYRKEVTWYGRLQDIYTVRLKDGRRQKILSRLEGRPSLSPDGHYVAFYKDRHWHLYDISTQTEKNLTEKLDVPFYNEDHDYPSTVPGYGLAGWVKDDKAVLIYDKYDIWKFSTQTEEAVNLTGGQGRKSHQTFRALRLDRDKRFFEEKESLLLSSYHNLEKHFGFYSGAVNKAGVKKLLEEKKRFLFLAKAKKADVLMYTRESFQEFPDIWINDLKFFSPHKVSNVNPQIADFAWGEAELVEWNSMDGIPLQGVLIKPADYKPGKRYPVIVYFYRFFSQRLYEFNQMVVNHRPNFPFYTSNGYAVFLPDIRFEIGHPGFASTKCLVPGVQKLIDSGVADPKAVGLHGHSWSGYQTAFVVTQTDIFACCVAGAPVSNMTSAYSGIRWGSGLARQFQYERTQSRIGGSLWEYPERYIENSPVFFADRIETPMLIMFGDEDGAVPWYQGIELYLALRRLEKDCVFLQYRGEPHHPQKYANKLDYSIKMKEYFDFYLKGKSAPGWIKKGVPYRGK